jgi:hypothetical protein
MTTPRRPFGRERPGQLLATRLKVLAAEITETQRLSRGKMYFSDDAVIDLAISSGVVLALVQGSRPDPYRVELRTSASGDVPRRNELGVRCDCDDLGAEVCKHAVAALFALAQEISIEPEVLGRWADGTLDAGAEHDAAEYDDAEYDGDRGAPDERYLDRDRDQPTAGGDDEDALAEYLFARAELPRVPILSPITHPMIAHPIVRAALHQSLDVLTADPHITIGPR